MRSHAHVDRLQEASDWEPLLVELGQVIQRGFARILERALKQLESGQNISEAVVSLSAPRVRVKFTLELRAPMWRLEHNSYGAVLESGGALPCILHVSLPVTYPLTPLLQAHGASLELASPGSLGREGAKVVTRALCGRVSEMFAATLDAEGCLHDIIDWVESTELHELAASAFQPRSACFTTHVRACVRFHHVMSMMKREYMRLWAEDLGVGALLASGQPAMLLVEGTDSEVRAFLDRVMKALHWGPTPSRLVSSEVCSEGERLPGGLNEVSVSYPNAVSPGGTYNGRDCVDFRVLAEELARVGQTGASLQLKSVAAAFFHENGRVEESPDGTGWVGYKLPEVVLVAAATATPQTKEPTKKRWGRKP